LKWIGRGFTGGTETDTQAHIFPCLGILLSYGAAENLLLEPQFIRTGTLCFYITAITYIKLLEKGEWDMTKGKF
jgi:hypothetical protein